MNNEHVSVSTVHINTHPAEAPTLPLPLWCPEWMTLATVTRHSTVSPARNTDRRGSFAVISIISTLHKQHQRMTLATVTRHSTVSPARNTDRRGSFAVISIISTLHKQRHGPSWKLRSYFYHLNSTQATSRTVVEASQLFLSSQLYTSNITDRRESFAVISIISTLHKQRQQTKCVHRLSHWLRPQKYIRGRRSLFSYVPK